MLVERLKTQFELNEPIFTNEILEAMQDYSRPRVYQLIESLTHFVIRLKMMQTFLKCFPK